MHPPPPLGERSPLGAHRAPTGRCEPCPSPSEFRSSGMLPSPISPVKPAFVDSGAFFSLPLREVPKRTSRGSIAGRHASPGHAPSRSLQAPGGHPARWWKNVVKG